MHRALQISEVLREILSHLEEWHLPSVARTARIFRAPAASFIWKELRLYSLEALLDVAWTPHGLVYWVDLDVVALAARYARLEVYGKYVRKIDLDFSPMDRDDVIRFREKILRLAAFQPAHFRLLPHLRRMHIEACDPDDLDCCLPLLAASLESLSVLCTEPYIPEADVHIAAFISRLRFEVPRLRDFWLDWRGQADTLCLAALRDFLTISPSLTTLNISRIGLLPPVLSVLARSTTLREIVVTQDVSNVPVDLSAVRACMGCNSFQMLKRLTIDGLLTATALLRSVRCHVEELRVNTKGRGGHTHSPKQVREFSATIPLFSSCLHKFTVIIQEDGLRESPFDMDDMASLLEVPSMKSYTFSFLSDTQLSFRDCHLAAFGHAWPSLENLAVTWTGWMSSEEPHLLLGLADVGALTLAGVATLAKCCPELQTLHVTGLQDTNDLALPRSLPASDKKIELILYYLEARQPVQVALFLYMIWPCVSLSRRPLLDKPGSIITSVAETISVLRAQQKLQSLVALNKSKGLTVPILLNSAF